MNQTPRNQTSMTPRLSVDSNIKMPSSPDKKTSGAKPSSGPSGSDDGFNEFLKVMNSSGSSTKGPNESVATVVSACLFVDVMSTLIDCNRWKQSLISMCFLLPRYRRTHGEEERANCLH